MQILDFIATDVKPLNLNNTIGEVKIGFANTIFTHLPIVENKQLIGLFAEANLPSYDKDTTILKEIRFDFITFFALEDSIWFDWIKIFGENDSNLLPVLDAQNKYLGYIELQDVLHFFSTTPFLKNEGNILVVSKLKVDYSISEIAQIVESNSAKLLGVFISNTTTNNVELTIKLYSDNINDVIHTFRRYNYEIIKGINEDEYLTDLKARSDYFQKYLNI